MVEDRCEVVCVHQDRVDHVVNNMPSEDKLQRLAEMFKLLGDPTRLKILNALSLNELCVCDITAVVEMSQSAVSHQLRLLRNARLVKCRRTGKMAYYSLDDDHVAQLIGDGLNHVSET